MRVTSSYSVRKYLLMAMLVRAFVSADGCRAKCVCMLASQLVCVEAVLSSSLIKRATFKDWGCNKSRPLEAPHPGAREQIDGVRGVGDNHGVTHHISGLIKRKAAMLRPTRMAF